MEFVLPSVSSHYPGHQFQEEGTSKERPGRVGAGTGQQTRQNQERRSSF